MSIQVRWRI